MLTALFWLDVTEIPKFLHLLGKMSPVFVGLFFYPR